MPRIGLINDEAIFAALEEAEGNYAVAARALGVPRPSLRDRVARIEREKKNAEKKASTLKLPNEPLVRFDDRAEGPVDWEKALERHGDLAAARREEDLQQKKAQIDLTKHGDKPVCIMMMSDVHIGSAQCDTEALIRHIKLLKNVPNLYTIIHGDLMEFAISERMLDAVLGQTGSPQEQARVYQSILTDLGSKVLAVISGNHDERSARRSGIDVVEFLMRAVQGRGVYLRDGGTITLKLGSVTYYWSAMHGDGMGGNSSTSQTAASAKHARYRVGFHDIHSMGHTHEPEVKINYEPRANGAPKEPVVLLKAGSYKTQGSESFIDRMGLTGPEHVVMPAVILFPASKRVIPFMRVEDAVEVLRELTHETSQEPKRASRGVSKGVRKQGGRTR